ncbi:MAG: AMP-binding protein [Planctomycetota bacterium]
MHRFGSTATSCQSFRRTASPATVPMPPIGRPIANTRCLVLDRHGQLVPIGVPGELHIGGDGVGLGYVGDAERTAEKFVVLPFGGHPGDRWYRTGDLVRWRPDGSLDYLGRIDRQVKIRGFRIEPAEVEAALSQHPAIAEVIVVMREDDPGDKHLVAYLVAKPATAVPTHADIRQFLQPMLPDHMIPAAFVAIAVLPLTSNGKLDHAALPLPPQEVSRSDPPRGPDEELVARVFRELLHRTDVDRQADFFHLGGDSLQALDAVTRISNEGNVSLRVTDLIRRPTIEGLAAAVSALRTGTPPTVPPPSSTPATTRPAPFVRRLREIASRHPQRRALISRSGTIAFQELHIRSNRLANHLLGLGMKPGERVRLGAGVSPDTLTAMLALLKVGVTIELGAFSSPAWVILDSPSDLAAEHTGQAPRFDTSPEQIRKMTGERWLMLDELIHAGSVEWRVMPSSVECPPLKAAGRDLAFRGFRRGDLVTYGEIERLAAKTRPGLPLFDIVGQDATPRRLLRRILQGRTLVAVGSVPPSDSSGASAGPQDRDTHRGRDVLAGCLATIGSAVRGAGERLFSVADRDFLTIKRRGHDGPIIACIGDTRPIADILRLSPPTAEVLSLGLDGIQVWPPRGYSVQEHVDCYLRILRHRPLHLGVLLVGFSQGGAICHALACALESLRNGGNVSKSGFTRPSHGLVNRALRAWLSHDRSDGRPPYAERVELMQDRLTEIRREHSWKVLSGSATLIGGRVWMADQGAAWRGLCSGALQEVPLDTDDHFAAFRDPASIAHWHLTLNAAYAGLEADGARTVRCLLIEPSSPQEN